MIRQLHDAPFVRAKLGVLLELTRDVREWLATRQHPIFPDLDEGEPSVTTEDTEVAARDFDELRRNETVWQTDGEFHPHQAQAAMLIGALDEMYHRLNFVVANPDPDDPFDEALVEDEEPLRFESRGELRVGAASTVYYLYARARRLRVDSEEFRVQDGAAVVMADDARMVLFGDWGSGIRNARILAQQIRESDVKSAINDQQELHVVHLGDAYYAGLPKEYAKRFTPYWPVNAKTKGTKVFSWTIPGNHDMYAGNRGFYQMLDTDRRFHAQKKCSYFLLENKHWQVFGLDTASNPRDWKGSIGVLNQTQLDWIKERHNGSKRCILLTHHQPFCAYSGVGDELATQIDWLLREKSVAAWFWGHDHHCAVYQPHLRILRPVLLGHGGFPDRPKTPRAGSPSIKFAWEATHKHRFTRRTYLKFGYAALQFQDENVSARLIDLAGDKHEEFTID